MKMERRANLPGVRKSSKKIYLSRKLITTPKNGDLSLRLHFAAVQSETLYIPLIGT